MKTVLYTCPYVPAEWIAAHGFQPCRILPAHKGPDHGKISIGQGIGVCPYARAFANEACAAPDEVAAIVVTTTCDQMRRMAERIEQAATKPVFLLDVPKTWQTAAVLKYYRSEIERLGRFLVELGGAAPSRERLAAVMLEWDALRAALRALRGQVSPKQFALAIVEFMRAGEIVSVTSTSSIESISSIESTESKPRTHTPSAAPIALVGGPLLRNHLELFDRIEAAGGAVALDASGSGERMLPAPFDRRALHEDPFSALVERHFAIPDVFRRPNSELYVWLRREMAARGVRGLLFRYTLWCDLWHAEAQRMKEWAKAPFLLLEAGDEEEVNGHAASRIEAFLEMLR
jgi:benzoyl-CoA reductase/2-hydroxyglutaryl-CoA dehydratase subunit BcrC/BadD/HgdB